MKYARIFVDSSSKEAPLDNAVIMPPSSPHCPQAGPCLVTVRAGGGAGSQETDCWYWCGHATVSTLARGCQGVPQGASSGDFALRAYYFYNQE